MMHDDLHVGQHRVIRDATSASGFSLIEKTAESFTTRHLIHGEMPFLLHGGFGNIRERSTR